MGETCFNIFLYVEPGSNVIRELGCVRHSFTGSDAEKFVEGLFVASDPDADATGSELLADSFVLGRDATLICESTTSVSLVASTSAATAMGAALLSIDLDFRRATTFVPKVTELVPRAMTGPFEDIAEAALLAGVGFARSSCRSLYQEPIWSQLAKLESSNEGAFLVPLISAFWSFFRSLFLVFFCFFLRRKGRFRLGFCKFRCAERGFLMVTLWWLCGENVAENDSNTLG